MENEIQSRPIRFKDEFSIQRTNFIRKFYHSSDEFSASLKL